MRNFPAVARVAGHVASGAGRRLGIVLAEDPRLGVEVHVLLEVAIGDAVFGLFVNFLLRVVGAEMTFAAIFRLTSATRGKVVARVTGRA